MAKAAVIKALQEQKDLQPRSLKWLLRLRFLTMWPLHRGAQDMAASFHKRKDPREKGRGQGERQRDRQKDRETKRQRDGGRRAVVGGGIHKDVNSRRWNHWASWRLAVTT